MQTYRITSDDGEILHTGALRQLPTSKAAKALALAFSGMAMATTKAKEHDAMETATLEERAAKLEALARAWTCRDGAMGVAIAACVDGQELRPEDGITVYEQGARVVADLIEDGWTQAEVEALNRLAMEWIQSNAVGGLGERVNGIVDFSGLKEDSKTES